MQRSFGRYLLIFVIFIFLLFFGLIKILGGHSKPKAPVTSGPVVKSLPSYADSFATVSMTVDGQVNGEDKHQAIRISVDQFQRKLDIINGYSGNVAEQHTQANTKQAYDIFLRSIRNTGFLVRLKGSTVDDERGQCPLGQRTIFELNDSGDSLSRLWTSTCGTKIGNFGGNSSSLRSLFQAQITDYNKLTSKVVL